MLRVVCFYIFRAGARLNNLLPENVIELKILKRRCARGGSFVLPSTPFTVFSMHYIISFLQEKWEPDFHIHISVSEFLIALRCGVTGCLILHP